MPGAPVTEPWDCSAAALIAARLPPRLRKVPGLLDRFGAVRLTPLTIGVDNVRAVPWTVVARIHTCPLSEVAATVTEDLAGRLARLVPFPGTGFAARAVTARVVDHATELIAGLLQTAQREHREDAHVPCRIDYRRRWKKAHLVPGPISSAVLCLPQVAASVIVTAQQHGAMITASQRG
jgi:hypothetical protein